jgi:hypothetical protein
MNTEQIGLKALIDELQKLDEEADEAERKFLVETNAIQAKIAEAQENLRKASYRLNVCRDVAAQKRKALTAAIRSISFHVEA